METVQLDFLGDLRRTHTCGQLRATDTGLFYFEFQAPNRFKTHILDGTPDDLRWNRVDGRVWVQT